MKEYIGGIQKFSVEDGPGIRTTVFIMGCPLSCRWCHNPELIPFEPKLVRIPSSCVGCGYCLDHCPKGAVSAGERGISFDRDKCNSCFECADFCYAGAFKRSASLMTAEEVMAEVIKDRGFYEETGGGMTLSGGEILSHVPFAEELLTLAEENSISVCLDTSGHGDGEELCRMGARENVTHILYDMKCIDPLIHREYTGRDNALILKNLRLLAKEEETRRKLIMRMPLIGGVNDGDELIDRTAELYKELGLAEVTLLPYHDLGVSKLRNIGGTPEIFAPPTNERLLWIKERFEMAGINAEIPDRVKVKEN